MIWIDYIILIVIGFSMIRSFYLGFVYEALSLTTWISAFFVSNQSHKYVMMLLPLTYGNNLIRKFISILLPFILTMIAGTILNYFIRTLVVKNKLSGTDKVLGICFGAIRGILIIALVIFCLNIFTDISKCTDWRKSQLIPHFNYVIKIFFDYFKAYRIFRIDKKLKTYPN
ncbi:CvpA family protein [Candidatus Pantoea edessiphila]|uniref:Colicin V production protein n=1 Tax=Candidatus Pantoea edessiphila TaxID=2044610 RepID=A0A2P5SWM2_9GAMM|nr:CvpA family protein [Candidatus Pantoea edessiphila]PPI86713.1 colicin V production protein [Candidatus Pantoea edessiphila]